jgi:hypothetical protein
LNIILIMIVFILMISSKGFLFLPYTGSYNIMSVCEWCSHDIFPLSCCDHRFCPNNSFPPHLFKLVVVTLTSHLSQSTVKVVNQIVSHNKTTYIIFCMGTYILLNFYRKFPTYEMFLEFLPFGHLNPIATFQWKTFVHVIINKGPFKWLSIAIRLMWSYHIMCNCDHNLMEKNPYSNNM